MEIAKKRKVDVKKEGHKNRAHRGSVHDKEAGALNGGGGWGSNEKLSGCNYTPWKKNHRALSYMCTLLYDWQSKKMSMARERT